MALDDQTASDDIPQYNGTPNTKSKFKCDVCVDVFFDCDCCFENHEQLHHIKTVYVSRGKVCYKCDECCDVYFECKHCLNVHKIMNHDYVESNLNLCDICKMMLSNYRCLLVSQQRMLTELQTKHNAVENPESNYENMIFYVLFIYMLYLLICIVCEFYGHYFIPGV